MVDSCFLLFVIGGGVFHVLVNLLVALVFGCDVPDVNRVRLLTVRVQKNFGFHDRRWKFWPDVQTLPSPDGLSSPGISHCLSDFKPSCFLTVT